MSLTRRRPSIHVLTTVDRQSRTGDEACIVARQKFDAAGDFVGLTQSANGNLRNDLFHHIFRDGRQHFGADIARRDCIGGHAITRTLCSKRLGKAMNARLRSCVIHLPDLAAGTEDALKYRVPFNVAFDGNTVELSTEQMEFAENTLRYQTSLQFLNRRISGLMTAIKGE